MTEALSPGQNPSLKVQISAPSNLSRVGIGGFSVKGFLGPHFLVKKLLGLDAAFQLTAAATQVVGPKVVIIPGQLVPAEAPYDFRFLFSGLEKNKWFKVTVSANDGCCRWSGDTIHVLTMPEWLKRRITVVPEDGEIEWGFLTPDESFTEDNPYPVTSSFDVNGYLYPDPDHSERDKLKAKIQSGEREKAGTPNHPDPDGEVAVPYNWKFVFNLDNTWTGVAKITVTYDCSTLKECFVRL